MKIDYQQLSAAALEGVLETFIQREGTDYGEYEISLELKRNQLLQQLRQKTAVLVFDEESESINIVTALEYQRSIA